MVARNSERPAAVHFQITAGAKGRGSLRVPRYGGERPVGLIQKMSDGRTEAVDGSPRSGVSTFRTPQPQWRVTETKEVAGWEYKVSLRMAQSGRIWHSLAGFRLDLPDWGVLSSTETDSVFVFSGLASRGRRPDGRFHVRKYGFPCDSCGFHVLRGLDDELQAADGGPGGRGTARRGRAQPWDVGPEADAWSFYIFQAAAAAVKP